MYNIYNVAGCAANNSLEVDCLRVFFVYLLLNFIIF